MADDLIGKKFNFLTVISRNNDIRKNNRAAYWNCKCDCGNYTVVDTANLKRGHTKSCGCNKNVCLPTGESAFNVLYYNYKRSANRRNYEFTLTKPQAKTLFEGICHYCGKEPYMNVKQTYGKHQLNGDFIHNGIDRVDTKKGYIYENCVSCCWDCNRKKGRKTKEEFLDKIKGVK